MKLLRLILALSLPLIAGCVGPSRTITAGSPPSAPAGYHWESLPKLSDEFEGNHLDDSKWLPYQPYYRGRPPSRFSSNNVVVSDGHLELLASAMVTNLSQVKNPNKNIWVHSACVASKKPIASYGYYAARMKASRLSMTSSFWFQGKGIEIDVVEQVGASQKIPTNSYEMLMNTHYFKGGWKKDKATPKKWKMPTGSADDYHVYGVWWKDKDNVWFYHNGEKVAEAKTGGEFLVPMYLFFDTEIFSWDGLPTMESLNDPKKNTMKVDWVRSWQLVKSKE